MANSDVVNICFHGIGAPRRELEPGKEAYWPVGVNQQFYPRVSNAGVVGGRT